MRRCQMVPNVATLVPEKARKSGLKLLINKYISLYYYILSPLSPLTHIFFYTLLSFFIYMGGVVPSGAKSCFPHINTGFLLSQGGNIWHRMAPNGTEVAP